jgi:hypothetical protein
MPESAFEFFTEWSCHNEPEDTSVGRNGPGFYERWRRIRAGQSGNVRSRRFTRPRLRYDL